MSVNENATNDLASSGTEYANVGTVDAMATYLTDGYWNEKGGSRHSFDSYYTNKIYVDVSELSTEGKKLARWAMEAWEAVADIDFVETYYDTDITFEEPYNDGAWSSYYAYGATTTSAIVSVSESWVNAYGSTIDSYTFSTYLHEIGHALGLGHQGSYNGSASYGSSNTFTNDSWQMSVMSYFSQSENTSINASYAEVVTPMIVDIAAIQDLYGTPGASSASAGATVYGVGHTGNGYMDALWDAAYGTPNSSVYGGDAVTFTIYDHSGVDTINFSNDTNAQYMDLRAGGISNVFGLIGNVIIAQDTGIENYTAGTKSDTVMGNSLANTIQGRGGNDTIYGSAGDDSIYGGIDDDVVHGGSGNDYVHGGDGDDVVGGGSGNDTLDGSDGNDTIYGGYGTDDILGGSGDDFIYGGDGDDTINAGIGDDYVVGATGADSFQHNGYLGNGTDAIGYYWAPQGDKLVFTRSASADDFMVTYEHSSNDGERYGSDTVQEALVVYKTTGQVVWVLVDGETKDQIDIEINGQTYDLLA